MLLRWLLCKKKGARKTCNYLEEDDDDDDDDIHVDNDQVNDDDDDNQDDCIVLGFVQGKEDL